MAGDLPVKYQSVRTRFLTLEVVRHGLDAFQALEQLVSNDPREYKCEGVDAAHGRETIRPPPSQQPSPPGSCRRLRWPQLPRVFVCRVSCLYIWLIKTLVAEGRERRSPT